MPRFSPESLTLLRQRIDLVDVLSPYVDLKRAGAAFKGLCPFHDEKTPSFMIQRGDTHYHCFGCGAHGDAIQFLMQHQRMGFSEAVEHLAEKFHVPLEKEESRGRGPPQRLVREALEKAREFYHCLLLHTEEGHHALRYLYDRGLDLAFLRTFRIGWSSAQEGLFSKAMRDQGFDDKILVAAGLVTEKGREMFRERITFPILAPSGGVIGFSARKIRDSILGGKYVNTPETLLFKKSRVLFGMAECRRRIAKEKKAIIVEGQLDTLRLIYEGANIAVAGQGTAFGEAQADDVIALGVEQVFLAMDGDRAGQEATAKIGTLLAKRGAEVRVVELPIGSDPDTFVQQYGIALFLRAMETSLPFLEFLVRHLSQEKDLTSPAAKNALAKELVQRVREWEQPLLVHESLRRLAHLLQVPEEVLGVGDVFASPYSIRKSHSIAGWNEVDPYRILEEDFIRWLLLKGQQDPFFLSLAQKNLTQEDLRDPLCQKVYRVIVDASSQGKSWEWLSLVTTIEDGRIQEWLEQVVKKSVPMEKARELFKKTIQKILDRNWLEKREEIRKKIQSHQGAADEVMEWAKEFDVLKKNPPRLYLPDEVAQNA